MAIYIRHGSANQIVRRFVAETYVPVCFQLESVTRTLLVSYIVYCSCAYVLITCKYVTYVVVIDRSRDNAMSNMLYRKQAFAWPRHRYSGMRMVQPKGINVNNSYQSDYEEHWLLFTVQIHRHPGDYVGINVHVPTL